jgi:hypothetical protein
MTGVGDQSKSLAMNSSTTKGAKALGSEPILETVPNCGKVAVRRVPRASIFVGGNHEGATSHGKRRENL